MADSPKLLTINMELYNLLFISYLVPADRIRPLVPTELALSSLNNKVFISAVAMQCRMVHLFNLTWPGFNYDQLNLRTYVIDPETGDPAVYFFRSAVSSRIIPAATLIIGIPWTHISFNLLTECSANETFYRAVGNWNGDIDILMRSSLIRNSQDAVIKHITEPLVGFTGRGQNLKRIVITHNVLDVRFLSLMEIKFNLPVKDGLLDASELNKPDSVLIVPQTKFSIFI
ncbi:MAG: DUF2071 domain-containing protein [Smithella sp.]